MAERMPTREELLALRDKIEALAEKYRGSALVSSGVQALDACAASLSALLGEAE